VPLLVAYGVITQEQGTLWQNLVLAIAAAVVPIVVASLIRNYNDNDAATTVAKLETEQAWITSGALDNATPVRE
jgi:hypothetical protein